MGWYHGDLSRSIPIASVPPPYCSEQTLSACCYNFLYGWFLYLAGEKEGRKLYFPIQKNSFRVQLCDLRRIEILPRFILRSCAESILYMLKHAFIPQFICFSEVENKR